MKLRNGENFCLRYLAILGVRDRVWRKPEQGVELGKCSEGISTGPSSQRERPIPRVTRSGCRYDGQNRSGNAAEECNFRFFEAVVLSRLGQRVASRCRPPANCVGLTTR
jgi:hypothetical protein